MLCASPAGSGHGAAVPAVPVHGAVLVHEEAEAAALRQNPDAGPSSCSGFPRRCRGGGFLYALVLLSVLRGGAARGLAEALDEIVDRVEGEALGDLPNAHVGGFEQHPGALHFGEADVLTDRQAGLFLAFFRQIL